MSYETIEITGPAEHVRVVTLSRPQAANSFDTRMAQELADAFSTLPADLRCVILTGSGYRAFCAGADLKERDGMTDAQWSAQHVVFEAMGQAILAAPMPVIAAVNGAAFGGGCEIVLLCDFAYAATSARFALPEATLGIMPGLGATQTLTRRAGTARAKEVIAAGRPFTADEALAWGVVNRVCEPQELLGQAIETAVRIAASAPLAVREIKRAIDTGAGLPLDRAMALELESYNRLFVTEDRVEGVKAWGEKRKPDFKGR